MYLLLAQTLQDSVPKEVATQVPGLYVALAAILVVVAAFLAYLIFTGNQMRTFITDLGTSCHASQEKEGNQNRECLTRATICIEQNNRVLGSVSEILRRVHGDAHHDEPDFSSGWFNRTDKAYTYTTRDGDDLVIEPGNAIIPTPEGWRVVTLPQWREWKRQGK